MCGTERPQLGKRGSNLVEVNQFLLGSHFLSLVFLHLELSVFFT